MKRLSASNLGNKKVLLIDQEKAYELFLAKGSRPTFADALIRCLSISKENDAKV